MDHPRGAAVGEQRGVGGEEPPPQLEVDVVVRVEPGGAPGVHGHRGGVVVGRRRRVRAAPRPELRRVQRRVGGAGAGAGAAGEARREGVAVGDADRVRACTYIITQVKAGVPLFFCQQDRIEDKKKSSLET